MSVMVQGLLLFFFWGGGGEGRRGGGWGGIKPPHILYENKGILNLFPFSSLSCNLFCPKNVVCYIY